MNVDSSFYGYSDWQPFPSPNTTPQSEKFAPLAPSSPVPSHASPDRFWTPVQAPVLKSNGPASMAPSSQRHHSLKRNSAGQQLAQNYFASPTRQGLQQHDTPSFPTSSFLEKFEAAHVDDIDDADDTAAAAASHMRTPPPTKDASARRKNQQPIKWQTPSTVASRRMSTPGDAWLKRLDARGGADSSPLNFHTPSQFPAVDYTTFPSASLGQPLTAPAYNGDLFWDPNSNFHANFSPAPTLYDDPFVTAPQSMPMSAFGGVNHLQHGSAGQTMQVDQKMDLPTDHTHSQAQVHSNALVDASSAADAQFNTTHGVDPSMLFTSQPPPLNRSQSFCTTSAAASKPINRPAATAAAKTLRQPRSRPIEGGLRRSFSDAKRADGSWSNRSSQDLQDSLHSAHIPRRSSPLKRQHPPLESRYRKSVQLVVDQTGTAKTVIKMVPIDGAGVENDDDDGDQAMQDRPSSRQDNAKDALKEAMAERRRARHSGFF